MHHIGVDGCKAGWIAVYRDGDGLEWRVESTVEELWDDFPDAERILVDVPIGLPWAETPIRPPDRLARKLLGRPRGSSVFSVPCREALAAKDLQDARAANQFTLGCSITEQGWGICGKIREVDAFLRADRERCKVVREIHPEVCFWALAGRQAMKHKKSLREGRQERLDVLRRYEPDVEQLLQSALAATKRKDLQADDVLDAVAAFVTAEGRQGELSVLTGEPSRDLEGLPMEMLYLEPSEEPEAA